MATDKKQTHKVTGRPQGEPKLLACLGIHRMLHFDYPMDPYCSRPNINFLLTLLFPVPFNMFLPMTGSHVHFASSIVVSVFLFYGLSDVNFLFRW